MKQPHTEQSIRHTDDQQNTGNHHKAKQPDAHGADRFGGTRAGAGNVEGEAPQRGDARALGTAGGGIEQAGSTGQGAHDIERVIEKKDGGGSAGAKRGRG